MATSSRVGNSLLEVKATDLRTSRCANFSHSCSILPSDAGRGDQEVLEHTSLELASVCCFTLRAFRPPSERGCLPKELFEEGNEARLPWIWNRTRRILSVGKRVTGLTESKSCPQIASSIAPSPLSLRIPSPASPAALIPTFRAQIRSKQPARSTFLSCGQSMCSELCSFDGHTKP